MTGVGGAQTACARVDAGCGGLPSADGSCTLVRTALLSWNPPADRARCTKHWYTRNEVPEPTCRLSKMRKASGASSSEKRWLVCTPEGLTVKVLGAGKRVRRTGGVARRAGAMHVPYVPCMCPACAMHSCEVKGHASPVAAPPPPQIGAPPHPATSCTQGVCKLCRESMKPLRGGAPHPATFCGSQRPE